MNKVHSMEECIAHIKPGSVLMVGGFMGVGSPHGIIDALVKNGVSDLTLICNDTSWETYGIGKMVLNKQFSKIISSHIGLNKESGRQLTAGETEFELVPQGTLAERIRAAGAGLGGILTPTGVGTSVQDGKQVIELDGIQYLLELPLRADVAIIAGTKVDKAGNVYHAKTTRNFNPIMAMAADTVIVEAEELVEIGEIDPHLVMTPATLVDCIVLGGAR
ncbi:MAG: 3-oxoacid CoA-transferase subunit A [Clostridia bacterium]|nr:3-oxoacid CoA-transferase subunit A [Clostridia bacterium]